MLAAIPDWVALMPCSWASRGAKVVVNDLGAAPTAGSVLPSDPRAVVSEITAAGGEAVADLHSVADEVAPGAVGHPDRVDALGQGRRPGQQRRHRGRVRIRRDRGGPSRTCDRRAPHGQHLDGAGWCGPTCGEAGYGRTCTRTLGGMWGMHGLTVYGTANFVSTGLPVDWPWRDADTGSEVNGVSGGGTTNSFHHSQDHRRSGGAAGLHGRDLAGRVGVADGGVPRSQVVRVDGGIVRLVRLNGCGPVVRDDPGLLEPGVPRQKTCGTIWPRSSTPADLMIATYRATRRRRGTTRS